MTLNKDVTVFLINEEPYKNLILIYIQNHRGEEFRVELGKSQAYELIKKLSKKLETIEDEYNP